MFGAIGLKPNIVFIMVDALGPFDLSCTGSGILKTPNIDRIAHEGIQFTRAYSGGPVCAQARSSLLTGKHMGHTSVRGNLGGTSLEADDVTVAEVLKKAGYACGGYGKWGVGDVRTPGVPEKQGFDGFFGYDHQVGEILSLLDELGIDDNSIVFFCSDIGGTPNRQRTFHSNRHLRGKKGDLYEGGLRMPLPARWPTRIKPGSKSDLLCCFPDVMPTLAELTGTTTHLPADIDGISGRTPPRDATT